MTLFTRDSFGRMGVTTPTQLPERGPRVKIHRNAKTTPHMRALIVQRVQSEHWRVGEAAAAAGVARRTAAKWLARHRAGGVVALADRSSRPAHSPRRTSADRIAAITALRHERLTAWTIAVRLQVPRSTVARVLVRVGLNRLSRLTPPAPIQRYEYAAAGALVHLDVKPLVRILRPGHRMHGDRRTLVHGAGWEYVHVAVDDYSRVAYVEVLPDQRGATTARFLRRTLHWFARRGVTVRRVLTDNGGAYRSDAFQAVATRATVRRLRSRPYRPQTNGKAERFIQTLLREWAYVTTYPSSWRRTRALRPWLRSYNTARPHTALGYHPPCSRFPRAAQ
jgi:transposase InsO family protein